ncbi:hypothetical protein FGU71_10245 [Erythrobacter insulae]|uniref:DUF2157 domain-containing protein n=1 Tax=Erythrobacter insulae TaxID=2584124 RepID=A0A547PDI9_9SPHN|nr:hypothetical protein [Erythrobacter insulae]TRD12202.1 hypothetical protein FGU71_10245 [Erythrobacter insulae]
MYSEDDINSAVDAGVLTPQAAQDFRNHMSRQRELPRSSEENFRLINSFNDIFVAIGIVILLLAVGAIGQALAGIIAPAQDYWDLYRATPDPTTEQMQAWRDASDLNQATAISFAGLLVAITAWPLAEFFTNKRRMALPSILLLLAFVGGVFAAVLGVGFLMVESGNERLGAVVISFAALVAAGGAYLHWRRFMVPITVAAGAAAVAGTIVGLIVAGIGPDNVSETVVLSLVFLAGLGVFALAMRWDISDRERTSRRSDVAFWLHLLAAPMIAHPIFALIGVTDGDNIAFGAAVSVLAVYIGFGLIAVAIDRRALLVSALAYVLFALTFLFRQFGAVELNFALTALVIGSGLLSLSAFWQPIRHAIVSVIPESVQDKLPATTSPANSSAAAPA